MTSMVHSPARALDVGSVIAGTYTIEGLIGKGGMGAVFIASHARLPGKKVAIKVLHADVADGDSLARFKREAEIASRLGHPNIVEVHDWNQLPDGTPYIVYELLNGESLDGRLRRGPMSYDEAMNVLRQVGSALAAAHREGIVHRDLKPQNIFLVQADDGVSVKAKVLDFGISKIRGSTTVKTQDTAMLGTPQYMAPEQATGQNNLVDGRTDVFALGAVVYEMFAGVPAFQGSTIPEVVFKVVYEQTPDLATTAPGVPPHVAAGVTRALSKKPNERWEDVGTFVEALTGSPLASGNRGLVPGISGSGGSVGGGGGTGAGAGTNAGMGSGSRAQRSTGPDALAATMGSGDHASAMAASMRASMAAAQTVAGTAESGNAASPIAVSQEHHAVSSTPAPGSKTKTIVIVSITVLTIAAALAVVVMTGGGDKQDTAAGGGAVASGTGGTGTGTALGDPGRPEPVDTSGGGSGSTLASGSGSDTASGNSGFGIGSGSGSGVGSGSGSGAVALIPTDAGVSNDAQQLAQAKIDAGVKKPKVDAGAGSGGEVVGDGPDDEESDPALKALLADARALLASDPDAALRAAKKITTKFPKAQAAWAIRTQANCNLEDQEAARADFRRISRGPIARRTRAACKAQGIDL
jgi:serine/threonine protein kinase